MKVSVRCGKLQVIFILTLSFTLGPISLRKHCSMKRLVWKSFYSKAACNYSKEILKVGCTIRLNDAFYCMLFTGFQVTVLHVYIFQTFITDGCQIQYQQQWCFRVLQKEIHQKLNLYTDVVQLGMSTN